MHAVAPTKSWYVPSAQGEHRPLRAAGLDVPGLQAVATATPVEQKDPAGQMEHCVLLLRPGAPLNVPSGHGSGVDAPASQ